MTTTSETGYQLEGSLLEACSCGVLCPCWIGEDPDGGTCEAFNAYHFDSGTIRGVDVSGLSFVTVHRIPGNVLAGNWRAVVVHQRRGLGRAARRDPRRVRGQARRPAGRPRRPVSERSSTSSGRRSCTRLGDGQGTLRIGDVVVQRDAPVHGAGRLRPPRCATRSSPPCRARRRTWRRPTTCGSNLPEYDFVWSFDGRNAIQADWKLVHAEDLA